MPTATYRKPVPIPVVSLPSLRKSHGMTQPEVVARIQDETGRKWTVGALSAVETGQRGASVQFLTDLAAVFGLEVADIWTTYEPRAKDKT